jgi:hypothetical protein
LSKPTKVNGSAKVESFLSVGRSPVRAASASPGRSIGAVAVLGTVSGAVDVSLTSTPRSS